MTRRVHNAAGLNVIGALSVLFSILFVIVGLSWITVGVGGFVLGLTYLIGAVLLLPTSFGVLNRENWGRLCGVVAYGLLALAQIGSFAVDMPSLAGLVLLMVVGGSSLYLLLAGHAFDSRDREEPVRVHRPGRP